MCQFYSRQPDLLVLDLMMPTIDGWQVWRRIRTASDVPIFILTAVTWDQDVVCGLDCGADITSPSRLASTSFWLAPGPCCTDSSD